ncbi:MAG: phosphatase PAP2 family protein [Bacteroidota bacterium]|nr:phosphatase PAP2 family protein [Bacteroidota bacterium]
MLEYFIEVDKLLFIFINTNLANSYFDFLMPVLTDWDKTLAGRVFIFLSVFFLAIKGGTKGRIVITLLVITIAVSDQFNSSILKSLIGRPRPCHIMDGTMVVDQIRLLVNCGSGYSFPSSHATNYFATATLISFFYSKTKWLFFVFASSIAFSRVYIGVHFPSDVVAGAFVGTSIAFLIFHSWLLLNKKFFRFDYETSKIKT